MANSMELKVTSPSEKLPEVKFNYDELKQGLTERLVKYNDLVYTDDTIKSAKTDRASLNKLKSVIKTRRLEIKKMYLKPYEDAEAKLKELEGMIDDPTQAIDKQVKEYEERKKTEKKVEIEALYNKTISDDNKAVLKLDDIFDPRWLNVTFSMTKIEETMKKRDEKIRTDLRVLHDMDSQYVAEMTTAYMTNLDISDALQKKKELEDQAKRIAEREKRIAEIEAKKKADKEAEEARIAAENKENEEQQQFDNAVKETQETIVEEIVEEREVIEEPIEISEQPEPEIVEIPVEKPQQIDVRIWVTEEQKKLFRAFLIDNNIKYGKVE